MTPKQARHLAGSGKVEQFVITAQEHGNAITHEANLWFGRWHHWTFLWARVRTSWS